MGKPIDKVDYLRIGRAIRNARKEMNITQAQLAEKVGRSSDYIQKLETASKSPSLATLHAIACSLGLSIDEMILHTEAYKDKRSELDQILMGCSDYQLEVIRKITMGFLACERFGKTEEN